MSERLFLADENDEKVRDRLSDHLSSFEIREFLVELTKLRATKMLDTAVMNNQDTMSLMLCGTSTDQIIATRRWINTVVLQAIMAAVDDLAAEEAKSKEGDANESSEQGPSGEAAAPLHQPDDDEGGSEAGQ